MRGCYTGSIETNSHICNILIKLGNFLPLFDSFTFRLLIIVRNQGLVGDFRGFKAMGRGQSMGALASLSREFRDIWQIRAGIDSFWALRKTKSPNFGNL